MGCGGVVLVHERGRANYSRRSNGKDLLIKRFRNAHTGQDSRSSLRYSKSLAKLATLEKLSL